MADTKTERAHLAYRPDQLCLDDFDFELYTDGGSAGPRDFGGSGANIVGRSRGLFKSVVSATTFSGAYRAEFQALLDGLHAIVVLLDLKESVKSLRSLEDERLKIFWLSDNEALVMNVRGEGARRTEGPMWAAFDWYAQYFDVHAYFMGRNVNPLQESADRLASSTRVAIKEHYLMLGYAGDIIDPSDVGWRTKR